MFMQLRPAFVLLLLLTLLTGLAYPLAITGIAQMAFPHQANGSLEEKAENIVGSRLIGQSFAADNYFHGRLSATNTPDSADATKNVDAPYNAANSAGSNLGPTSKALMDRVASDVSAWRAAGLPGAPPADAVTTSASGLDPHISPAFAMAQSGRVASARKLPVEQVKRLAEQMTEPRDLGFLGEARVNFFLLNLALDELGSHVVNKADQGANEQSNARP